MGAPLGPDEGMNALRHPDCRFCNEYERLLRGPTEEVRQLKARVQELEENAGAGEKCRCSKKVQVQQPATEDNPKDCGGSGEIPTGECKVAKCKVAMSGPTCFNAACPPCRFPATDPCLGCSHPDCPATDTPSAPDAPSVPDQSRQDPDCPVGELDHFGELDAIQAAAANVPAFNEVEAKLFTADWSMLIAELRSAGFELVGKPTGARCDSCDRQQRMGDEGWESCDAIDYCPDCFVEDAPEDKGEKR